MAKKQGAPGSILPESGPLVHAADPDLTTVAGWFVDLAEKSRTHPQAALTQLRQLAPAAQAILEGHWNERMAKLVKRETGR